VNEQAGNAEYEFLWKLLANPADPNHSYIFSLQSLVNDYPQSGALRALLMPNGDKRHLKHAAAYFNPRVLHKLSTAPDSLPKVTADQVVFVDKPETIVADAYLNVPIAEPFVSPIPSEHEEIYAPIVDDASEEVSDTHTYEQAAADTPSVTFESPQQVEYSADLVSIVDRDRENIPAYIDDDGETIAEELSADTGPYSYLEEETKGTPIEDEPVHEEIAEAPIVEEVTANAESLEATFSQLEDDGNSLAKQYDAYLAESEAAPTSLVSSYEEGGDRFFHQAIDDEVYDEIVSIEDIGLEQLAILNKSAADGEENYFVFEPEIDESDNLSAEVAQAIEQPAKEIEPAQPLASTADLHPVVKAEEPAAQRAFTLANENNEVSKYNDEKMPYTFMWWLDKTRKEHADIYQPYAKSSVSVAPRAEEPKQKEPLDELQQQYYQNIVSTTSITELDKSPPKAPVVPPVQRKEDKIIERFIHEEPHIQHPTGVKLDNENKAKRSSEDKEELVTETLARIYTEQMLYHKAILTYKKLMLKYPEKSLYFAGQIEQLENKIN
jgi:hypothetical protein